MRGLGGLGVALGILECLVDIGCRIYEARKPDHTEEKVDALEERVQALEEVAHRHVAKRKPRSRK